MTVNSLITDIMIGYWPLLLSSRSDLVRGSCRTFAGPSKNSLLNRGFTTGMQINSNLQSTIQIFRTSIIQ